MSTLPPAEAATRAAAVSTLAPASTNDSDAKALNTTRLMNSSAAPPRKPNPREATSSRALRGGPAVTGAAGPDRTPTGTDCFRGRAGPVSSAKPVNANTEHAANTVRQPSRSPNTGSTAVDTSTSSGIAASRMPKARTRGVRAKKSTRILEELGSDSTRRIPAAASNATNHAVLGACDSATMNKQPPMQVSRPTLMPPTRSVTRPSHTASTTAGTADNDKPNPNSDELIPKSSRR